MTGRLIRTSVDWIVVFRERIAELGLSHREVDELAGFGEGYTSKILCGDRKPGALTIERLSGALKLAFAPIVVSDAH